jgi:uncharacterized protein
MSNVSVVKSVYASFAKGDVPAVLAVMSSAIQWTEAKGFPYGGTYRGSKAVLDGVFMRIGSEWDGFTVAPREFIDGGERVVALGTYSGKYKATGKSFSAEFAHVWTVASGKVVKFVQYVDTLLVNEALQP